MSTQILVKKSAAVGLLISSTISVIVGFTVMIPRFGTLGVVFTILAIGFALFYLYAAVRRR